MLIESSFPWFVGWALTFSCAFYVFKNWRKLKGDPYQNNSDFRLLQIRFLFPYLVTLFSESLQTPYLYCLLHSFHYSSFQIAFLYGVGIFSDSIFRIFKFRICALYGRRVVSLVCLAAGTLACSFKYFNYIPLLFVGRIFDGVFSSLINSPFQLWYNHEHVVRLFFPAEWMTSTFTFVSIGSAFLTVIAGYFSEVLVMMTRVYSVPFAFSILGLTVSGVFIGSMWLENYPIDAPLSVGVVMRKTIKTMVSSSFVMVLCLISTLMESSFQVFTFVWAPILISSDISGYQEISFGAIWASMSASYLCGLSAFSSHYLRKVSNSRIVCGSVVIATISWFYSFRALSAREEEVFWASNALYGFHVFYFAIGIFMPAADALQATLIPGVQRSNVSSIIRIVVNVLCLIVILGVFPKFNGYHDVVFIILCFLVTSCTLAIILEVALSKKYNRSLNDYNHIVFDESITSVSEA